MRPLVDNAAGVNDIYGRGVHPAMKAVLQARKFSSSGRPAAVLVLVSADGNVTDPAEADLLLTVRASTLRQHSGQVSFPGGATDPGDGGPVGTALREAHEETGLDPGRVHPLTVMDPLFIPPSGFHVSPVLAYSADPGPVLAVDPGETAEVSRVKIGDLVDPANRIMVSKKTFGIRYSGPAFLLPGMLVWGFTGQIISAMLEVSGWARPWDTRNLRDLDELLAEHLGGSV
ncbi:MULTISPECIES: CoA pyrophosphatase [unclassified Mycobacteroides]|uniref:NUDIX hydrolase n=1 Tax=unclassified Mycobacteroides TaxID=2618759 RepID=UPI001EF05291|nr:MULTISPECIES: CoA pyrophosphatase [unclassified Mycobacteroides]